MASCPAVKNHKKCRAIPLHASNLLGTVHLRPGLAISLRRRITPIWNGGWPGPDQRGISTQPIGPALGEERSIRHIIGRPGFRRWWRDRMRVVLAQPRGFCAGVERAIAIVERALEKFGPPIYVRHEIVHNRHVVE